MTDSETLTWHRRRRTHRRPRGPGRRGRRSLQRGEAAAWFSPAEPRRQTREDALRETGDQLAGLRARRDQIDAERDALVDRFPGLKSVSPDDDD